jgi:hypothetical protein|tara:strand:- start:1643 stop:2500 length:858 start_codon:yes stop_codon:yes gene_type:complete
MKNIDTIVEDIYSLFEKKNEELTEKEVDKCIDDFASSVKVHVKDFLKQMPQDKPRLRLSTIGRPDRQLWYDFKKPHNEPLAPSTRIKFLYGYILEELLIMLASISGHKVTQQQKQVEVEGVKGHQDCFIDGVLVDCKSASGIGYSKFKYNNLSNNDPFGYLPQISAYAEGNGVDEAGFLVINKSTGEICYTKVHSLEMINAKDRVKKIKKVVNSDIPPDKCYSAVPDGKSGNYKLNTACMYCNYKFDCWSDSNDGKGLRVFNYSTGKRYFTQVEKEPNVEEVHDK